MIARPARDAAASAGSRRTLLADPRQADSWTHRETAPRRNRRLPDSTSTTNQSGNRATGSQRRWTGLVNAYHTEWAAPGFPDSC